MKKQYIPIQTEWDKRRKTKEKIEFNKVNPTKKERKAATTKLRKRNQFIDKTAKYLKNNQPKSEQWFASLLKEYCLTDKFLDNVRLNDVIPDFINIEHKIVIEIDGSIHWNNETQLERDKKKDKIYKTMGYKVYRINHNDTEKALETILELIGIFNN